MLTTKQILETAHQDYKEHGYAIGMYQDNRGNRCALGSLNHVLNEHVNTHVMVKGQPFGEESLAEYRKCREHRNVAEAWLNRVSLRLHEETINDTNDNPKLGRRAVLQCFELALKEHEDDE